MSDTATIPISQLISLFTILEPEREVMFTVVRPPVLLGVGQNIHDLVVRVEIK